MPDLTIERLQLFLLVVMPGIITIKIYDLFNPPEKRDFGSSLLEAMAYSLLNLALWVYPLISINQKSFIDEHLGWYAFLSLCFLVISPALLAWGAVWLRKSPCVSSRVGHPNKTAWDDFFKRKQECWILFHMKDGKMLGGYFGEKSYVSTFPQQPEIYVEEVWRVDCRGAFLEMVEGTLGMVIRQADCDRLEFLVVEGDN